MSIHWQLAPDHSWLERYVQRGRMLDPDMGTAGLMQKWLD